MRSSINVDGRNIDPSTMVDIRRLPTIPEHICRRITIAVTSISGSGRSAFKRSVWPDSIRVIAVVNAEPEQRRPRRGSWRPLWIDEQRFIGHVLISLNDAALKFTERYIQTAPARLGFNFFGKRALSRAGRPQII